MRNVPVGTNTWSTPWSSVRVVPGAGSDGRPVAALGAVVPGCGAIDGVGGAQATAAIIDPMAIVARRVARGICCMWFLPVVRLTVGSILGFRSGAVGAGGAMGAMAGRWGRWNITCSVRPLSRRSREAQARSGTPEVPNGG